MRFDSVIDKLTGRTIEVRLTAGTFDDERILDSIRAVGECDRKFGSITIEHDKSDCAMVWSFGDEGRESDVE